MLIGHGEKNTKIGDIFLVILGDASKRYLQYIANDLTLLNSDVIRVFKKTYPLDAKPTLSEIIRDDVEFYAHCVIKWGVKLGAWEKIGNNEDIGKLDITFRDTSDCGSGGQIKISNQWYVWKINDDDIKPVGKLEGDYRKAEIGPVIPADSIVHRMRTGKYDFVYPEFE